jgi:uncharacterized membrane protein
MKGWVDFRTRESHHRIKGVVIIMRRFLLASAIVLLLAALPVPRAALGVERPGLAGEIALVILFNDITVSKDDAQVDVQSSVLNLTGDRLLFSLSVTDVPVSWIAELRGESDDYQVGDMALAAQAQADFFLRLKLPADLEPGDREIKVRAVSSSGEVIAQQVLTVTIGLDDVLLDVDDIGVSLDTTYPDQTGTPSERFEFDLEVRNETGREITFSLAAQAPANWEVIFLPSFDQSKVISSIGLGKTGRQVVKVRVIPPLQALPGRYPIVVAAFNEEYATQMLLVVNVTGQGELRATLKDSRLDVASIAGKETPALLRIANIGAGDLETVTLLANANPSWEVIFEPAVIDFLASGESVDVEVIVMPPKSAIPGDYLVSMHAVTPQVSTTLNIRVAVEQSTLWRWFGLAMVLVVMGGLLGLYVKLSLR